MRDNVFEVEVDQLTEKCLLAATEHRGACCKRCRKPLPLLVDGFCTLCAIREGLNPLKLFPAIEQAS